MELSEDVLSVPHLNSSSLSEVNYRLAWARTLLKNYGAVVNSARGVWSITAAFSRQETVDGAFIEKNCKQSQTRAKTSSASVPSEKEMEEAGVEIPEEVRKKKKKLYDVLIHMNPYSFEKLSQRLLRECGFEDVHVTKKSGDGGIDGTGKLKINGIFSFNIAFQCKRYQGSVGAADIRDFR